MDGSASGAEQFLALSQALKAAGRTGLRRELHKAMRKEVRAHMPKTAEALADALPSGVRKRGAKVNQVIKVKTGKDPGVSVVVPYGKRRGAGGLGASNAQMLNRQGQFRHPVHPDPDKPRNEWRWVNQSLPGAQGWFDEAWSAIAPDLKRSLEAAMERIAEQVVKEAGR